MTLLDNIRIVLVRTFHPGNIGSAARSMKTMGLSDLCLVNPRDFPSHEATKMAAGAADILEQTSITTSLTDALADSTAIIASTARPRGYDLPELLPDQAAKMLVHAAMKDKVSLIFGPERMGLHNEDIQYAKYRVTIPANPEYNSLNMAAAVQTLSYEIHKAYLDTHITPPVIRDKELPTSADIEMLYQHLQEVLKEIGFLKPHSGETMQRIRHLLTRAEPDKLETNILRGILSSIQKDAKK